MINKPGGLSIFHRLLIAFLIVLIGLSGILTTVFYVYIKDAFIRHVEEGISQGFQLSAHHFTNELKMTLEKDLSILSANPVIGQFMMSSELEYRINEMTMEDLFLQSIQYAEGYESISFVDYTGMEKIRVERTGPIKEHRDLSKSILFTKIKRGHAGKINVEGPFPGKQGKASFLAGIYKTDEDIGEFGGAVIVEYNLERFIKELGDIKILGENPIWLLTPDGQALKQPENGDAFLDPRPHIPAGLYETRQTLMLNEGMVAFQDLFIVPGHHCLRLAISVPSSLLLKDIKMVLRFFFIVFLISVVLLSLIIYYLSGYLSRPIIKLASAADSFAKGDLSAHVDVRGTGEVQTLVDSFNRMTNDLKNTMVSKEKLQGALSEISALIESVIRTKDHDVRFDNPNIKKCYEVKNCKKEDCPCYGKEAMRCWKVAGTFCGGKVQGVFAQKYGNCSKCDVYKAATTDPIFQIGEHFNNMMHILKTKNHELEEAYNELQATSVKLEKSNSELGQFAYIASHDLQEPLRKVTAFGDRLKDKYAEALGDQGKDYLERMQNAAGRMQTLINDLLTYSRVTTKAQPFASTDLSIIAKEVLSDLEIRIEQVKGRVEVGELPVIDADPLQMRQLFQNLIGNALKFSKKGEAPVVKVHGALINANGTGAGNEYYQLTVEDNGIGFDEQYTERIFGVFQRLHGRSEYEGSGIGLSVCKKIVERHGGSITAKGSPGEGAKFIITLPVKQMKGEYVHG